MPELLSTVVAELRTTPPLVGAACRGRGPFWDGDPLPGESVEDRDARHQLAARICGGCPARRDCGALAASYPANLVDGVWAGRNRTPTRRRSP